jgi:hypothetical protein
MKQLLDQRDAMKFRLLESRREKPEDVKSHEIMLEVISQIQYDIDKLLVKHRIEREEN